MLACFQGPSLRCDACRRVSLSELTIIVDLNLVILERIVPQSAIGARYLMVYLSAIVLSAEIASIQLDHSNYMRRSS